MESGTLKSNKKLCHLVTMDTKFSDYIFHKFYLRLSILVRFSVTASSPAAVSPSSLLLVSQANRPPAKLNLLTCQVKRNPEEKKSFDLFSRKMQTHNRLSKQSHTVSDS